MEDHLFLAETPQGHVVKVLVEVLNNCSAKTLEMKICGEGIFFHYIDNKATILVNVALERDNFRSFICSSDTERSIGLNLGKLHTLLRSIKKKDFLTLFIKKDSENELGIQISSETAGKKTSKVELYGLRIHDAPFEFPDIPIDYLRPKVIPSTEFQKACKRMNSLGKVMKIKMIGPDYIGFSCDCTDVINGRIEYGTPSEGNPKYEKEFTTFSLNQFVKIPGLSPQLQFHQPSIEGVPLKISLSIGYLGKVDFYIKDRHTIEDEENSRRN